jgi:hypothetical protein
LGFRDRLWIVGVVVKVLVLVVPVVAVVLVAAVNDDAEFVPSWTKKDL